MTGFLRSATILAAVGVASAEGFDRIGLAREREARERAMARRIEPQQRRQPKSQPETGPTRPAGAVDVPGLREALERFVRDGRGVVILYPDGCTNEMPKLRK